MVLMAALLASGMEARASLMFGKNLESFPAYGLKMPILQNGKAMPLPPPKVFKYTFTRGGETWQEDLIDPATAWYATQHIAEWRDAEGNCLILGAITALPFSFADKHISQAVFDETMRDAYIENYDAGTLQEWMRFFTSEDVGAPKDLAINRSRLSALMHFPTANPTVFAYVFKLNTALAQHVPEAWLALVVQTTGKTKPEMEKSNIERNVLAAITASGRFDVQAASSVVKNNTLVRDHATREAAHKSVENLKDWWYADSNDFVALSNNRNAERFILDLLGDLQTARTGLFASLFPGFAETADDVAVVRFPATAREYVAYVGKEYEWSGGLFVPVRRELVLRPSESRSIGSERYKEVLTVALHEAFHQYLHQATGGRDAPLWYNEGTAMYVECAKVGKDGISIGENEQRVRHVELLVTTKKANVRELLTLNANMFYSGDRDKLSANYSLAWGLMYYIYRGAPLERNKPYAGIAERLRAALMSKMSAQDATLYAFDGIDLYAFEQSFNAFWKNTKARADAKKVTPAFEW